MGKVFEGPDTSSPTAFRPIREEKKRIAASLSKCERGVRLD
jgi:hypothetical protein